MDIPHIARSAFLSAAVGAAALLSLGASGCSDPAPTPTLKGQVHLTLLHTSDIHSRLFPYNLQLSQIDAGLGLGTANSILNVGGAARVSHVIGRERARADRVLHLSSGDCFQGAPVFNYFSGEPELRAESAMGTDAMVLGNHEFDKGVTNLAAQLQQWADFPILGANYSFDPSSPLAGIAQPFTVFDVKGLKVAVIGMGNLSSLGTVFSSPNRFGILPLNTTETMQAYLDLLRPDVDVVVALTHLGVDVDERMIETTTGLDVVLGGHNHIVLQPPKTVQDCSRYCDTDAAGNCLPDAAGARHHFILLDGPDFGQGPACSSNADCGPSSKCYFDSIEDQIAGHGACSTCNHDADCGPAGFCFGSLNHPFLVGDNPGAPVCKVRRECTPRNVLVSHSGAFAKFVGRLDLIVSNDKNDIEPPCNTSADCTSGVCQNGRCAVYDTLNGFEVIASDYQLLPVTEGTPADPVITELLQPYEQGLDAMANLDTLVGYALDGSKRNSTSGGDSPLGNLVATAMWTRIGVETDFSLTNTTGIRADLVPGAVTVEQMFNIFPFDNTIAKITLSGLEVCGLFDYTSTRSTSRGCISQAQIAGARVAMNCKQLPCKTDAECGAPTSGQVCDPAALICSPPGRATNIYIGTYPPGACQTDADCAADKNPLGVAQHCNNAPQNKGSANYLRCICTNDTECPNPGGGHCTSLDPVPLPGQTSQDNQCDISSGVCWQPIQELDSYVLATSSYLAGGGSGFYMLQHNTTGVDTGVQQRDAVIDYIRAGAPCGANADGQLKPCSHDTDCGTIDEVPGYICACPSTALETYPTCETDATKSCGGQGSCILAQCRIDVAALALTTCADASTAALQQQCQTELRPCATAGEQCKYLACIDQALGSVPDARIKMEGQ